MALVDFNVAQLDRLEAIDMLHRAGIAVMVGNVLAQGHLIAGKIGRIRTAADAYYLLRATLKKDARRLAKASRALRPPPASVTGMSAAQAAMAYALSVPQIQGGCRGAQEARRHRQNLITVVIFNVHNCLTSHECD